MLKNFSDQVVADLNGLSLLIDLLDSDSVSALVGEYEDGRKWVNYSIQYNRSLSKDGAHGWFVFVESWADNYTDSIVIADTVATAFTVSGNYYNYISAESEPLEIGGTNRVVTKQIFNIKQ
tara:strand:+ start:4955 stop:5317 length:363 start_codon:yes stop_codon:yes gene_type:complete